MARQARQPRFVALKYGATAIRWPIRRCTQRAQCAMRCAQTLLAIRRIFVYVHSTNKYVYYYFHCNIRIDSTYSSHVIRQADHTEISKKMSPRLRDMYYAWSCLAVA